MEKVAFPTRNWIPVIIPYWTKREKGFIPLKIVLLATTKLRI